MPNIRFAIKRLPETNEWKVCVYRDNKLDEAKSYYTNDKYDAEVTLKLMEEELREHPEDFSSLEYSEGDKNFLILITIKVLGKFYNIKLDSEIFLDLNKHRIIPEDIACAIQEKLYSLSGKHKY